MTASVTAELTHLRAGGVSVVLDLPADGLPRVRHWGADLGEVSAADLAELVRAGRQPATKQPVDVSDDITILPEHASFWVGRPGVAGSRSGRDWSALFSSATHERTDLGDGTQRVVVTADDEVAALRVVIEFELLPMGLLRVRGTLTNTGADGYGVNALRIALPVPPEADEIMDFTGRHNMERVPQRQPFTKGLHARENRTGRTGLDAAYVLMAGRQGFGFRSGEVWGVHVAWSGNQEVYAELLHNGSRVLGAGELLETGELTLAGGDSYASPWVYANYGMGLDALAARFHAYLRSRPSHPSSPRPVLINTWEAVYFDHDLDKLKALADAAAEVGVERFVLDDGWFGSRRDDTTGLGDWTVARDVWPDGLGPLIDYVRGKGMQFGLWVEPEMVNLDSDLARAHPEWLFSAGGRVGIPSRHQHVLDLGHPEAYAYIRDALLALLDEYDIGYLKWDHNRYLNDAGHTPGGEPGIHEHTLAAYRLFAELRAAHPEVEIESCASGGGRIDLGIMELTDRVWASDCIDALERQQIQRYTQLLLPPEMVGMHIGSPRSHTTGRVHDLSFRAGAALWGHLGIEWDVSQASEGDKAQLAEWVAFHKSVRTLLHTGTVVNADHPDPSVWVNGVVAPDHSEALFAITAVARSVASALPRVRLPGLDPGRRYTVSIVQAADGEFDAPEWASGVTMSGRALEHVGVTMPILMAEHQCLIRAVAA